MPHGLLGQRSDCHLRGKDLNPLTGTPILEKNFFHLLRLKIPIQNSSVS